MFQPLDADYAAKVAESFGRQQIMTTIATMLATMMLARDRPDLSHG